MTPPPLKTSLLLATGYVLVCGLYIWLSGEIALRMAPSAEALRSIELYKGLGFILVSGVAVFAAAYALLVTTRSRNDLLASQRRTLVDTQARVLAGTFASSIAHDINNILSVVDLGITKLDSREIRQQEIERLQRASIMIKDLTTRLQRMGKPGAAIERSDTDIVALVRKTVDFARRHRKVAGCRVVLTLPDRCAVPINRVLFEQMLMNLVVNAAEATESSGTIELRVGCEKDRAFVEVHDDGPGIREEDRQAVLIAYHTTKSDGTGLGLVTVKSCAEVHGGTVEIGTSPLGGALVRVMLPLSPRGRG